MSHPVLRREIVARLLALLTAAGLCACGAPGAAPAPDVGTEVRDAGLEEPPSRADTADPEAAAPDAAGATDAARTPDAPRAADLGPTRADGPDTERADGRGPADAAGDGPRVGDEAGDGFVPRPGDATEETDAAGELPPLEFVAVPAGTFEMGDHSGLGGLDPSHPSDELPLHAVTLDRFAMSRYETTCAQYAAFLNAALRAGTLAVAGGEVTLAGSATTLFQTREAAPWSPIGFDGTTFQVFAGREAHPIVGVRWLGAAAFANWLSRQAGLTPCHDLVSGAVDLTTPCYRLPTEAEWEYAALGAAQPYPVYPWGDTLDPLRANWPDSNDPWELGPEPKTTPVGFFDGSLRHKADFDWPDSVAQFQTHDGRNGYGLCDLAGNAWEWVVDWYGRDYYATSPPTNPPGPTAGAASPMPDGQAYRGMRGGNWFNGTSPERPDGHSRVSNRDPSYFRGPGDPNGPWFHVGFRLVHAHPESAAQGVSR